MKHIMSPIILGVSAVPEVRHQCSVVYILLFIWTSYCWLPNSNQTFLTDPNFHQSTLSQSSHVTQRELFPSLGPRMGSDLPLS